MGRSRSAAIFGNKIANRQHFGMYFFHLFRSFLPLRNPIGFGASDFIALAVAALLVLIVLSWAAIQPYAHRLANRTASCMLVLGMLPIVLRLGLLMHNPV